MMAGGIWSAHAPSSPLPRLPLNGPPLSAWRPRGALRSPFRAGSSQFSSLSCRLRTRTLRMGGLTCLLQGSRGRTLICREARRCRGINLTRLHFMFYLRCRPSNCIAYIQKGFCLSCITEEGEPLMATERYKCNLLCDNCFQGGLLQLLRSNPV